MSERATVAQGAQIGVEATPGTAVPADTILDALSFTMGIGGTAAEFRPDGHKFPSLTLPGKEWTDVPYTGKGCYRAMGYILDSLIAKATPTAAGTGYQRVYAPQDTQEDTRLTYTLEKGSSVRAASASSLFFASLAMALSRDTFDVSGDAVAKLLGDGITMTGSPSTVSASPIMPRDFDVYVDDTAAALGNTKLLRDFTADINLGPLIQPIWPLDSTQTSFASVVEIAAAATVTLGFAAIAESSDFIDAFRDGRTKFVRIEAKGNVLTAGTPPVTELFRIDVALKMTTPGQQQDIDGVYGWKPQFVVVQDGTWGKAIELTVINDVASYLPA